MQSTRSSQSPESSLEVKTVSSTIGKGVFATKSFSEGEVVFSELPLLSSQLVLSKVRKLLTILFQIRYCYDTLSNTICIRKQFVRACERCEKFLNLHHHNVVPFFPKDVSPHLPKRYPELYNYQLGEGDRHHYCSAECLDQAYMNFFQLIDGSARARMMKELVSKKKSLDSEWCTALPTIPPDLVLKALAMEILALNPKLRPYHSRDGKPTSSRTPKQKLKVLESFKPTKRSMVDLGPLCEMLAQYANTLLMDFSPFEIDSNLILDTIKRIMDHHQVIVINVHQGMSLEKYMASGSLTQEDVALMEQSDKEIKVSGAGDLHLAWHPVASAVYTAQSLLNHSCTPNVYYSTMNNMTHQLDVVATRPIAVGEEIRASYIDASLLTLPTSSRKAHITTSFGFTCECPACSIAKK